MTWRWHQCLVVVVVVAQVTATQFTPPDNNYHVLTDHQVWEAEGQQAVKVVAGLEVEGLADILGHSSSTPKFRVHPDSRARVAATLAEAGVSHRVLIRDLASFVKEEQHKASQQVLREVRAESCTADSCPKPLSNSYMTFEQMEFYLMELASTSSRVELDSIGKSIEGRDLWRVHIKPTQSRDAGSRQGVKPNAVWFEAGIHAREWISPAVVLHLIDYIVNDDATTQQLDAYMVPMANPDGYEFSRTSDRLWRKNRRPNTNRPSCSGVDLNRNWATGYGAGASANACSEVFKGAESFSEPETEALSNEMMRVNTENNLRLVMSVHSYGQILLYPWGYTTDPAPQTPMMKRVGRRFIRYAKKSYGTQYTVANSAGGFYIASGATDDWAKDALETPLSYTLELRDKGRNGFVLPPKQILPTSREVWRGMKKVFSFINNRF